MKLLRVLGGELGWGGALGTLLLAGGGAVLLVLGALELRQVAVPKPVERPCAAWLAEANAPRWVSLTGCRVDVTALRTEGAKRYLGLGTREGAPVLLEVTEPALVTVLQALPTQEAAAYVAAHAADFVALTEPAVLSGWVRPLEGAVEPPAPGALVLVQGAAPPRGQVLLRLVVGIVALALVLRSMGRRWLLEREAEAVPTPGDGAG